MVKNDILTVDQQRGIKIRQKMAPLEMNAELQQYVTRIRFTEA